MLFSQLITLRLGEKEKLRSLFGRVMRIQSRLLNWNPPIELPEQLMIVCVLRLLSTKFHATRTIIMSTSGISLCKCKEMLLDVENRDAEIVAREVGSSISGETNSKQVGAGLLSDSGTGEKKIKKKTKERKQSKKIEKYLSEGPCPVHGSITSNKELRLSSIYRTSRS